MLEHLPEIHLIIIPLLTTFQTTSTTSSTPNILLSSSTCTLFSPLNINQQTPSNPSPPNHVHQRNLHCHLLSCLLVHPLQVQLSYRIKMDDRSSHYMFGSRFGDLSDRNDIDTYSSNSDADSDSDWDRAPAIKVTFITPAYVTDYPALPAERFIGFPHIVLTGNPPRQPVLKENEKVNLEHADGITTYLYYHSPEALKAFLDMENKFFVFRTEAKKDEQHDTDIILIREENKITVSPLCDHHSVFFQIILTTP